MKLLYRVAFLKDTVFAKEDQLIMKSANTLHNYLQAMVIEGVLNNPSVSHVFHTEKGVLSRSVRQWHDIV
jgi:hypothetical protein